jgi:FecR protein
MNPPPFVPLLRFLRAATVIGLSLAAGLACAQTVTLPAEALILATQGMVEVVGTNTVSTTLDGTASTGNAAVVKAVRRGELIRTAPDAFCDVLIPSAGTLRLLPGTEVRLPASQAANPAQAHSLELLKGKLFLDIDAVELNKRRQGQFRLKTPTTVLAVRGTRFFAVSEQGLDTAGVHQGQVGVLASATGASALLTAGKSVDLKGEALSALRAMSDEEKAYGTLYDEAKLALAPMEPAVRKAEVLYRVNEDNSTALYLPQRNMMKLDKGAVPGIEGQVLSAVFKANTKWPTNTTWASLTVHLDKRLPKNPLALVFQARTRGVLRANLQSHVGELNGRPLGTEDGSAVLTEASPVFGDWITVVAPIRMDPTPMQDDPRHVVVFTVDPTRHEKMQDAIRMAWNVIPDQPDYALEIGPIRLLHRPGK